MATLKGGFNDGRPHFVTLGKSFLEGIHSVALLGVDIRLLVLESNTNCCLTQPHQFQRSKRVVGGGFRRCSTSWQALWLKPTEALKDSFFNKMSSFSGLGQWFCLRNTSFLTSLTPGICVFCSSNCLFYVMQVLPCFAMHRLLFFFPQQCTHL